MGGNEMNILYNDKTDLLYIRLDDRKQNVVNKKVSEDIVLDIGEESSMPQNNSALKGFSQLNIHSQKAPRDVKIRKKTPTSRHTCPSSRHRKYEVLISWSNDDQAFIAEVPELPGCIAHGSTSNEALLNCQEAIDLWLNTAKEFGREIPTPKGRYSMFT
jgi:predicted RNase H-like HicB family nuclease